MSVNLPDPTPIREPGATFGANKPAATAQAPQIPDGWASPTGPTTWNGIDSSAEQKRQ